MYMLVRNLREQGDYERALTVQDENLALAIANEQNIASARKNVAQGMIPQLTERQLRSREEQVMDGLTALNKAKNNLSSIFTPQQVESFMTGMTEEFADFVNVYWNDLKKEFETKRNLTKVYFDKIVQMFMKKLEQQTGISTERVNRPAVSSSINEAREIKKIIPDREFIRTIVMRLRDADQVGLSRAYATYYYMLPSDSILQLISEKPEVERQRYFEALTRLLRGVNPNNRYWEGLSKTDLMSLRNTAQMNIPDLANADTIFQLYSDVIPGFMEAYQREREVLLTKTLKKSFEPEEPIRRQLGQPATPLEFLGQPAVLEAGYTPAQVARIGRRGLTSRFNEQEKKLGSAGFSQPAAVVASSQFSGLPDEISTVERPRRGRPANTPSNTPVSAPSFVNPLPTTLGKTKYQLLKEQLAARDAEGRTLSQSPAQSGIIPPPRRSANRYGKGIKSGRGIAPKETVYHDFGKFLINGNALDNQLLQVKYQAGGSIPGFSKKIAISDTFQDILNTLIDTGKLNKSQFKELDDAERRALETLLVKAGIGAEFGIKSITPTDELKKKLDRFELLKGMYNAGNNGVEVIHELRSLVLHFMNIGRITRRDALATLMELQ
jgi:hypothetical protein